VQNVRALGSPKSIEQAVDEIAPLYDVAHQQFGITLKASMAGCAAD
jgi:hypothetical protein